MRQTLILILLWPVFVQAQTGPDTTQNVIPKWSAHLDLLNFQDNYPAVLFSIERQFDQNFAIQQEVGMVVVPEAYNVSDFDKYLGFKGRTEFRLYTDDSAGDKTRTFLSVDFAYQVDQYVFDYFRQFSGFTRIEEGTFTRYVYGSHIRGGYQRVYRDRIIVEYSVGLGRVFYKVDFPEGYSNGVDGQTITDYPPLDPFSMNFRLKIGIILSKLVK